MNDENNLDEIMKKTDKFNYLLDAITGNSIKFESLPNELKNILKPFKDKIEKGESLTKEDYKYLKSII